MGVRTNVRGEDVRLYRLRMAPAQARALLLEYVDEANDLTRKPRFYNSLITNCTTQIFRMVRVLQPGLPLNYRVLLSGYVPDYVYDLGWLGYQAPVRGSARPLAHPGQGRQHRSGFLTENQGRRSESAMMPTARYRR